MQRLATPGLWEARAFGCRRGALGSGCKRTSAGHGVELHHEGGAGASESHDEAGEQATAADMDGCEAIGDAARCDVMSSSCWCARCSLVLVLIHLDSDGRPRPTKAPAPAVLAVAVTASKHFFLSFVPFFSSRRLWLAGTGAGRAVGAGAA